MESVEIVRKLVVGSEAIDRMRKEIKDTVSMVLGMISEKEIKAWEKNSGYCCNGERGECFRSPKYEKGCDWRLIQFWQGRELEVVCTLYNIVGDTAHGINAYQTSCPNISLEVVERVHKILPLFLSGMIKTFPFLTERLQPILNAADYAKNNGWQL